MKTFKLEREEGDESFAWTDDRGSVWDIICSGDGLGNMLVPDDTKELWLSICKTPKKGWLKAFVKDTHDGLYVKFDGKNYCIYRDALFLMSQVNLYDEEFYFKIEYNS